MSGSGLLLLVLMSDDKMPLGCDAVSDAGTVTSVRPLLIVWWQVRRGITYFVGKEGC